jgi:hypothetical protein
MSDHKWDLHNAPQASHHRPVAVLVPKSQWMDDIKLILSGRRGLLSGVLLRWPLGPRMTARKKGDDSDRYQHSPACMLRHPTPPRGDYPKGLWFYTNDPAKAPIEAGVVRLARQNASWQELGLRRQAGT